MLVMSAHYLYQSKSGILQGKEVSDSLWYLTLFRSHIFFGLIAIFLGPIQFFLLNKSGYKTSHQRRGILYVSSIFISGISGLAIAPYAMGGLVTAIGFTILSGIWILVTFAGTIAIINGNVSLHHSLMIISYALTFAAITQRTLLLIPLLSNVPFMPIYKLSAWLPWIFNLIVAYFIILRKRVRV